MTAWLQKWLTTEAVFSLSGGLWFVLAAIFPTIPATMPIPAIIPGFSEITPGLLVGVSLVPVLLKVFTPGRVPFVGTQKPMPDDATEEPKP